jgi:hypothetical protein
MKGREIRGRARGSKKGRGRRGMEWDSILDPSNVPDRSTPVAFFGN